MTCITAMVTHLIFEAPYRSLFRYFFESPRIRSSHMINGLTDFTNYDSSSTTFTKELDLNGNMLFKSSNHNQNQKTAESEIGDIKNNENDADCSKTKHCYDNPIVVIES